MIPAARALIRYTWAPGTRQVGRVDVSEAPADLEVHLISGKPRFIPEAERETEPTFEAGACDPGWMQGNPPYTPAAAFGEMLLFHGFASWDHTRRALLAFMKIEGCDWAKEMLGRYHPAIHDGEETDGGSA